MKAPSKNISASLRGQSSAGREGRPIKTGKPMGKLSMTVPGEGCVESPPGERDARSAAHYADVMAKQTGH